MADPAELLRSLPKEHLRETLYLSRMPTENEIGILPGNSWGLHYPDSAKRASAIENLLKGKAKPEAVADDLKPDALIFDAQALSQTDGFTQVNARILQTLSLVENYDWGRLADFFSRMKGLSIAPSDAQRIYEQIVSGRIETQMSETIVGSGKTQLEQAQRSEGLRVLGEINNYSRLQRVLSALKLDWQCEDKQLIRTDQRDEALQFLDETEIELYKQMRPAFREFTRSGTAKDYESLASRIVSNLPLLREEPEERMSTEMKDLYEDLEPFMDQADPIQRQDPSIPEEFKDTYDPRPSSMTGKEKEASSPWFEITPSGKSTTVLLGDYCSARSSYYDVPTKNWSNKTALAPYSHTLSGDQRQTISANISNALTSIPIPNHYALDMSSLQYKGNKPEFFRDQNGCFFVKTNGPCSISIDFLAEKPPFGSNPINEDTQLLYKGNLSDESERVITGLRGSNLDKAETLRNYLLSHHFYPGGGDLQAAGALQMKLRGESTGANYIQNLEKSEYLECYSANTLFIAMLRKVGIPARLVMGHKIQSAFQGKAVIDASTKHAWAEVWDGIVWRRFDATPQPKPQDKKKQEEKPQDNTPTDKADDGGIEQQRPPQEKQSGGSGSGTSASNLPGEASDKDAKEARTKLDQAQKRMEKMEKTKQDIQRKTGQADSVKDLKELKEQAESEDLLEDMKEELDQAIDAKKDLLTEELEKKLDEMAKDGFLDEKERDRLKEKLESGTEDMDQIEEQIEEQNQLYRDYLEIKKEIMPLVEKWYRYFVEQLPKEEEPEIDDEVLGRAGMLAKRALKRPSALMTGRIKNPRVFRPEVKPLFIASIMVDVSGSMTGEKLEMGRKLLIFYNELFSRISQEYGYIKYANYVFSDNVGVIKSHNQDYNSPQRYDYGGGERSTVKARLMQAVQVQGGTNMYDAVKTAAADLNRMTREFPDYASAFYLIGDGEDTCGNSKNIKKFLSVENTEEGFGKHMKSATLLGDESDRQVLAEIFGDENTNVASDFDELVGKSMLKFNKDIQRYLLTRTMTRTA